ncbi:MAG: DUF5074 domain-containing protein [Bacteroidales bacterium]
MAAISILLIACEKDDDFGEVSGEGTKYTRGNGVFVINEGNFGHGNASLSFLDLDSLKMENQIYYAATRRPLGDVAFSMQIIGSEAWLVVNNSARVEILDLEDLSQAGSIGGFTSPRFMLPVNDHKAYVSDLYAGHLSIIDLASREVSGTIELGCSSENLIMAAGKVFVGFWSNFSFPDRQNNQILVIDPDLDLLIDSLKVGKEPNSMALDKHGRLWVLCSGGFMGEEVPSLWQIDPQVPGVISSMTFPEINSSPTNLCINGTADTLYFLNQGIYRMPEEASALPDQPLISEEEHLFYALAVDPETSVIYTSDAIDYQQRGLVLRYSPNGALMDSFQSGIIPGRFVFN